MAKKDNPYVSSGEEDIEGGTAGNDAGGSSGPSSGPVAPSGDNPDNMPKIKIPDFTPQGPPGVQPPLKWVPGPTGN